MWWDGVAVVADADAVAVVGLVEVVVEVVVAGDGCVNETWKRSEGGGAH